MGWSKSCDNIYERPPEDDIERLPSCTSSEPFSEATMLAKAICTRKDNTLRHSCRSRMWPL